MRHIQKSEEPESFIQWKQQGNENWKPGWADFDGQPIKQDVKRSLLREQGSLCCYCEVRVDQNDGHIEHIQARHAYPDLALTYTNLLYSCKETPRGVPTTCGHARKPDDPVPVSPLDADCESRFLYTEDGYMYPHDENDIDAKETIRILNLNEPILRTRRAEAYEEVTKEFDNLPEADFDQWIDSELQPDKQGRLYPFWGTKQYVAETLR